MPPKKMTPTMYLLFAVQMSSVLETMEMLLLLLLLSLPFAEMFHCHCHCHCHGHWHLSSLHSHHHHHHHNAPSAIPFDYSAFPMSLLMPSVLLLLLLQTMMLMTDCEKENTVEIRRLLRRRRH